MFLLGLLSLLIVTDSFAYSFKQALEAIDKHPQVHQLLNEAQVFEKEADSQSSWGDPEIGVKARNVPVETLAFDESPMTGIEYSLSQKFPLSTKYSNIENSFKLLAEAKTLDAISQKKALYMALWNYAILKRQLSKDLEILKDNWGFLENMLKVTKRLYTNGKVGQQAVLELQIRKSELEAQLSNKRHQLAHIEESLKYFSNQLSGRLDLATVPWDVIEKGLGNPVVPDEKESGLKKKVEASELGLKAQKLDYVPDIKLSLAYVERDSEVDDFGNFVSAGVFLTLPLSSKKYAMEDSANAKRLKAENELRTYRLKRNSELKKLEHQILKVGDELTLLKKKTVPFARTSREITSKSYGLGNASYVELTQSELKLQTILLRQNELEAQIAATRVQYLYLRGDQLHEK